MAKINIDGQTFEVADGQNLLQAVTSLGIDLPYFCWHPALDSVGACRQCAVIQYKDENDDKGKLVMACMVPVEDGMIVSVADEEAVRFRSNIIEWLMVNHPHDCPVCDEGGECHLQDMTVMSGHNYRSYGYTKRTFRNQDLGPFIYHEMNRCITCYRCVRFYNDFAGGTDLGAFGAHDRVFFGRYEEGTLENEFSGNLVEVCPTGVFTDKTLRKHYTRKWDLQSGPSVCHNCSLGCNVFAGERYNKLVRILNRYNGSVNGYFICDRGRFGYEYVNADTRIRKTSKRNGDKLEPVDSIDDVIDDIAERLTNGRAVGIGSPRASLESNFALKTLVGDGSFSSGVGAAEHDTIMRLSKLLRDGRLNTASLRDAERADGVVVLGEDLTNTAPMLALAVRQAVRNQPMELVDKLKIPRWNDAAVREAVQDRRGPLYTATPQSTKLDDISQATLRRAPRDIARFGFAIAHAIDSEAPGVTGLGAEETGLAKEAAGDLTACDKPLVVGGISLGEPAMLDASLAIYTALRRKGKKAQISFVLPDANSLGIGLIGGNSLEDIATRIESGDVDTLILLENDLAGRCGKSRARELLAGVSYVVALDHTTSPTTEQAHTLFACGTFAESDGTIVNNEGRAQRFYQALSPDEEVVESWRWLQRIGEAAGRSDMAAWKTLDPIADAALSAVNGRLRVTSVAPDATFRIRGRKVARSPHRYSGRTAKVAHQTIHEPKPPDDSDSPLSFSMEGVNDQPPPSLTSFFWAPGWNSVQALSFYQKEIGQEMRGGDPGVRLFNELTDASHHYDFQAPDAQEVADNQLLVVPIHRIFGSEHLSNNSEPIRQRIPALFWLVNDNTAAVLGVDRGDTHTLSIDGHDISAEVQVDENMPDAVIGLMVDPTATAWLPLPATINTGGKS